MANLASKLRNIFLFCFLASWLPLGIVCLLASARDWRLYHRAEHWDRVEVTVTQASRKGNKSVVYHADYDFTYAGRQWHGKHVSITNQDAPKEFIAWCEKEENPDYMNGQNVVHVYPVLAWVNPADPSESMLYRQIDSGMWFVTVMGAVSAGVPVLVGLFWWRWRRSRAARQRLASGGENVYADQRFPPRAGR